MEVSEQLYLGRFKDFHLVLRTSCHRAIDELGGELDAPHSDWSEELVAPGQQRGGTEDRRQMAK
jgi:hypothetical protein